MSGLPAPWEESNLVVYATAGQTHAGRTTPPPTPHLPPSPTGLTSGQLLCPCCCVAPTGVVPSAGAPYCPGAINMFYGMFMTPGASGTHVPPVIRAIGSGPQYLLQ